MPELGTGPITLRIVRALNPRFPSLSEDEFSDVLDRAAALVQDHFALDVRFERGTDYAIRDLFKILPRSLLENAYRTFYRIPETPEDFQTLKKMIAAGFNSGLAPNAAIVRAVESFIPCATKEMGTAELAEAFAERWFGGRRRWHGLRAQDGETVIDSSDFHQQSLWGHLGYADLPADIVITKQLVASAQPYGFDPVVALSGGMLMGITGFSRSAQFRAYSMVSTFPFINDLGDLSDLGPDQSFDPTIATRFAALMLAKEIGLVLLRLRFTWTTPSCIMFPEIPGKMRAHLDALDAAKCRIGSEPAMVPGTGGIVSNRRLLRKIGG